MDGPKTKARYIYPKSPWVPLDPHTKEEISDEPSRNILDDEVMEGPPLGPGEIMFIEDFHMKTFEPEEEGDPKINIFLDRPKNSVIILSLGMIGDDEAKAAMADGTLGRILSYRLELAVNALHARGSDNLPVADHMMSPGSQ